MFTAKFAPGKPCRTVRIFPSTRRLAAPPRGLRSTSISLECVPMMSSAASARPTRCPTARTSGSASSSFESLSPMRSDSASEVPGTAVMWTTKWPSLSSGTKPPSRNGSTASPPSVSTATAAMTVRGWRSTRRSSGT